MHLPISSEDTLHFYRYLHTHIQIADEQFLMLIDVPIWDCAQQIEVYEVFNLDIPHRNYSACYDIQNKYLVITPDETSMIEISEGQFKTWQKANRQFCILNTPPLPALYVKDKESIQKRCSPQIKGASNVSIPTFIAPNVWIITSSTTAVPARITLICPEEAPRTITQQTAICILWLHPACCATSQNFHLPPHYKLHEATIDYTQQISMLSTYQHWNLEYGST